MTVYVCFFFQAEDGIRDAHWCLEFRRVLFRSADEAVPQRARARGGGTASARRARALHRRTRTLRRADPRAHAGRRGANRRQRAPGAEHRRQLRSEEHTSELQSLMRISYAVFCLKKKNLKLTNKYKNTKL